MLGFKVPHWLKRGACLRYGIRFLLSIATGGCALYLC